MAFFPQIFSVSNNAVLTVMT